MKEIARAILAAVVFLSVFTTVAAIGGDFGLLITFAARTLLALVLAVYATSKVTGQRLPFTLR